MFKDIYARLDPIFYEVINPVPVSKPSLVLYNNELAQQFNLNLKKIEIENIFSGNKVLDGVNSKALAYAGHQFGHYNPSLGDGRAVLLGQLSSVKEQLFDFQLKGSGRTMFSRQGDGRYALGPAIREYIMSEALYYLRIPTTRSLCVIKTGDTVYRSDVSEGAVLTRVASSHIRVGTFELFAREESIEHLNQLINFTIERHFPSLEQNDPDRYLKLLVNVIDKQINLITEWLRVGFIHGVMNTDNTLVSGETIDYGPCAMMGPYSSNASFSSIDRYGRYSFLNQPKILQWNMARFAETLLPFINTDHEQAIEIATKIIKDIPSKFDEKYNMMISNKIGFQSSSVEITDLFAKLTSLMEKNKLDYTNTFSYLERTLAKTTTENDSQYSCLNNWLQDWDILLQKNNLDLKVTIKLMERTNPKIIPRNYHIERLLNDYEKTESLDEIHHFLHIIKKPYQMNESFNKYNNYPEHFDASFKTFCGT